MFDEESLYQEQEVTECEESTEQPRFSFRQTLAEIPASLQKRCMKQFLGAFAVTVLTIICLMVFREWYYLIGFLFAGYIGWIGVSIVKRCYTGQIRYKRMVCIKAKKFLGAKDKLVVALRDTEAELGDENGIMQYVVSTSKKEASLLSENVLVNIYFDVDTPTQLLTWQIIGLTTDKTG